MSEDEEQVEMKPWMEVARGLLGLKEIKGGRHNPKVVELFKATGLKVHDDETPWCDAFVDYCIAKAGYTPSPGAMARDNLNWDGFEEVDESEIREGDLAIFKREVPGNPRAGHVGFFVGWKDDDPETGILLILGGNQNDQVKISEFPADDRVLGYRRIIE